MSNDKMREEFEAAFAQETVRRAVDEGLLKLDETGELLACTIYVMANDRDGDTYGEVHFASAWWAWQASRAAVDMTAARAAIRQALPDVPGDSLDHGLIAAFEAAGLGVRS